MKLRGVAVLRITAVSVISTMKVDRPRDKLSDAPMRVKMRSITGRLADSAGTYDPICAITAISAACRRYVDLPPILGPVIIAIPAPPAPGSPAASHICRDKSLGMK